MSQCVPSWDDVEDNNNTTTTRLKPSLRPNSISMPSSLDAVPIVDYEVAELTWKNGQLAMHGLGPPRVVKFAWNKPSAAETLETIVNQAHYKADELVPWLDHHNSGTATGTVSTSVTMTMDALVPSSATQAPHELLSNSGRTACSTRVGSCSSERSGFGDHVVAHGGGVAAQDWSSCRPDQSASGSETFGMESSRQLTVETRNQELGVKGFTSTSMGSPDDTISGKRSSKSTSPDEHDSVCHSRPPQLSSSHSQT